LRAFPVVAVVCAAASLFHVPAHAVSSTSDPVNWRLVPGQVFKGVAGAFDGLARINGTTTYGQNYLCSGSLLAGGSYVLTAAHCAANAATLTVDVGVTNNVARAQRSVSMDAIYVNPLWAGLDSGADLALLRLSTPISGVKSVTLSTTNDLGKSFVVAGYGTTNTGAASRGPNWGDWGYAHYGVNNFDVSEQDMLASYGQPLGDSPGVVYVSDFDNGKVANNTLQRAKMAFGGAWVSGLGYGDQEGMAAPGDSGGGEYVWTGHGWQLSAVVSWGWQFCDGRLNPNCDFNPYNPTGYGDLFGATAVYPHIEWINNVMAGTYRGGVGHNMVGMADLSAIDSLAALSAPVPEPESLLLAISGLFVIWVGAPFFARRINKRK
jgi:hypothetical protein